MTNPDVNSALDAEWDKMMTRATFWDIAEDLARLGWSISFMADKQTVTLAARKGLRYVESTQRNLKDCILDFQVELANAVLPQEVK